MTDKKITRRKVRHPRDFGDRELFKRALNHWIPSEKVDALYSELQGDFLKVCELSIEELKNYG
ncbi:MAG: DNA repair protein RadC, partial [Streptococcus salivarius]|nr:DNA repair protein RadC [Streptococcus salivarius]